MKEFEVLLNDWQNLIKYRYTVNKLSKWSQLHQSSAGVGPGQYEFIKVISDILYLWVWAITNEKKLNL